jgi:hypothetical protein
MSNKFDVRIDETVHQDGGQVNEVDYTYVETRAAGDTQTYRVAIKRTNYEHLATLIKKPTISFDKFVKVLRPFMMGHHAAEDIPEAFRLLDTDNSCTIDIGELAVFMPVIVPDANPHMLLHHVQKVDKNGDFKLNLAEFTDLINRGVGRDIVTGRL